jgi:hypothetical protein
MASFPDRRNSNHNLMPNLQLHGTLLLAGVLIALNGRANDIEPGKEFYTATRAGGPIVLDGNLTEWAGVPVLADPKFAIPKGSGTNGTYVLFEEYNGGTWTGPDDHTSAVQIVYDADNVYFGFVVTDDYHENSAHSAWNGDSVQLMIANASRTAQIALYNYALGGVEHDLGEVIVQHEAGPGGTEAVVTRNATTKKTIYEIKLPAASLGLTQLTAGTQFGLGMAINDGDEDTPGQRGWGGLGAHAIVFGKTPSQTALITLGTNLPGTDRLFFSAINPTLDSFSFRATDKGASIVAPASARLIIDGQTVNLTSRKTGDVTDFLYTPAGPFAPNSDHTYRIEVSDTSGSTVTDEGTFKTQTYALLTAADKVTPDTTKPGFIWRVHQNNNFQATDISRAVQQLAGLLGQNFADAANPGMAIAAGRPGANNRLPIEFEIDSVINLEQEGFSAGGIDFDGPMPGIPGTSGDGLDGIAAEIITYLELPAGRHTLVVNSDDGFRTTAGAIHDVFRAQLAGEFNGGRGAADTAYLVFASEAGVYPFRTIWYEGAVGASIEWKLVKADGTQVLLNDTGSGGFRAYRATSTPVPTAINLVVPMPGAAAAAFDSPITALIREGSAVVDLSSVVLSLNGQQLTATPTKAGNLITVSHQPATFFTSGSHNTASITYSAGGVSRTESWTFSVETYPTLTRAHQAVTVDKTKPGFVWRVFQNEAFTHTSLELTEQALAGQLRFEGQLLPNLADPSAIGAAIAPGTQDGPLVKFEIATVINLSQSEGESNGNFGFDEQMPGIPGLNFNNDGIDAEIVTFLELPAGVLTMGVNSDDGFRTQAGYINRPADGIMLGEFDAGRGATDTLFRFVVQEAGVYPFRTIWQEGGGGANIEWFTVKADGTKVLLNDTASGGIRAYRAGTAPNPPVEFNLAVTFSGGQIQISWTEPGVVLQESTDLRTWSDLGTAASPYRFAPGQRAAAFYRLKK